MYTERGSVLASATINQATQRKLTKKLFIASIICLAIGTAGLAAYLIIAVGVYSLTGFESEYLDIMLVFAVPFGFGLIFVLSLKKRYKDAVRAGERVFTYEFFLKELIIREFCDGKQLAMSRADYTQIVKVVEKPEYIFIYFIKTALCPIEKSTMTEAELNAVRGVLNLAVSGEKAELALTPPQDAEEK